MPWHALVVHFPIALLSAAVLVDLAALARRRPAWHRVAYGLLVAGTVGAAVAVVTGNVDAAPYRGSAAAAAIQDHEDLGTLTLLLFLGMSLGRLPAILRPTVADRRWLWAGLGVAGLVLLTWTGYEGGELVYERGVGVRAGVSGSSP